MNTIIFIRCKINDFKNIKMFNYGYLCLDKKLTILFIILFKLKYLNSKKYVFRRKNIKSKLKIKISRIFNFNYLFNFNQCHFSF